MSSDSTPTQPLINTYTTSYIPSDVLSSSLQRIPSRKWLVKYFEFNNISGEWNGGQTGFVYLDNTFPSEPPPRLIMTTKNDESSKTIFSFEITNCIENIIFIIFIISKYIIPFYLLNTFLYLLNAFLL